MKVKKLEEKPLKNKLKNLLQSLTKQRRTELSPTLQNRTQMTRQNRLFLCVNLFESSFTISETEIITASTSMLKEKFHEIREKAKFNPKSEKLNEVEKLVMY